VTKRAVTPAGASPADLNLGAVIFAGGMAGVAMWAIAIPPDVLKSRLQSAPTGTYSGFADCARKTIAADGVGALWKGFGPAMLRVRACLLVYGDAAEYASTGFPRECGYIRECVARLWFSSLTTVQLGVEASRKVMDGLF
jgi:hypothetical protein